MRNKNLISNLEQLEFYVERYAFVFIKDKLEDEDIKIPDDYSIRTFKPGQDEVNWSNIRNNAFAGLKGHEAPT
jgi:mycothiol synthase